MIHTRRLSLGFGAGSLGKSGESQAARHTSQTRHTPNAQASTEYLQRRQAYEARAESDTIVNRAFRQKDISQIGTTVSTMLTSIALDLSSNYFARSSGSMCKRQPYLLPISSPRHEDFRVFSIDQ